MLSINGCSGFHFQTFEKLKNWAQFYFGFPTKIKHIRYSISELMFVISKIQFSVWVNLVENCKTGKGFNIH